MQRGYAGCAGWDRRKRVPSRRLGVVLATLALVSAVVLALAGGVPTPKDRQPSVLVILVDALRADRLGVNGYPLAATPHIDALAAEGLSLPAFSHSTWTKPSIATLWTSLYPGQHGLRILGIERGGRLRTQVLGKRWVTLAEQFQAAGYATGAAVNQVHLPPRHGFAQGFEVYRWVRGHDAFELNRLLEEWLDGVGDRPFFGYLHYLDVHWPYDRVLPGQEGAFGPVELASPPPRADDSAGWFEEHGDAAALGALAARYDQEVAYADAAIGEVMEMLRARGRAEDTIVVVTADHGEGFGEHGRLQHGYAPYDELIRVPLVLRLPERLRRGLEAPAEPVGLIDLGPTLLDLAGLPPLPQAVGGSLLPLLRGSDRRPRLVFADTAVARAVRSRERKLMRFEDGHLELFDLLADPGEQHPLPCSASCRELRDRLAGFWRWLQQTSPKRPDSVIVDAEDQAELRSLGYL